MFGSTTDLGYCSKCNKLDMVSEDCNWILEEDSTSDHLCLSNHVRPFKLQVDARG